MKQHVVVIGSGLAGSLLCNELVKHSEVTLLEKGPQNGIYYPDFRFIRKKLAEVHTCCYGKGGTTNLWHNGLIPIDLEDVAESEFREALEDSEKYIDSAASALFFPGEDFSREYARRKLQINSLSPLFEAFRHGIDCLIYPKRYNALTVSPDVKADYLVDDIGFDLEEGRVASISYRSGANMKSVQADRVIIAAGALGTPVLLRDIVKTMGNSTGGHIGTGFIDHPMGFVGKVKVKRDVVPFIRKLAACDHGSYISRSPVRLKSPCGKYTACVFFRPALTMDNRLKIYKYKSSLGASTGAARLKSIFSWKLFHPDILAEIYAHLLDRNVPSRVFNILLIAEQYRGDNRVFEKNGTIHIDWNISDEEIRAYQAMLSEFAHSLSEFSDDIRIQTDISSDWLWSAAHHSGTTPLGAGDDIYVDKDLRLVCCDNVYVCDGSVLQQHSYANTGLAIGQLAFRLADRLKYEE